MSSNREKNVYRVVVTVALTCDSFADATRIVEKRLQPDEVLTDPHLLQVVDVKVEIRKS